MAGITLAQAQAQLEIWLAASQAVSQSQSYRIESNNTSRYLSRADAAEVREQIKFWDGKVKELTPPTAGGRRRTRYVVPE